MYRIRSGFLTLAATASMLLWASIAVTPATAAPVSFNFTGTLNDPNDFYLTLTGNTPAFSGGEAVSGTITYTDPTPDFLPLNTGVGRYNNAVTSLTLNIGSGAYQATLGNTGISYIQVTDNGVVNDSYALRVPLTGPAVLGDPAYFGQPTDFVPLYLRLDLSYGIPSPFTVDALAIPSLTAINSIPTFRVVFENESYGQPQLLGTLSSITAVPLPPAVILFGAGLVALIGLGARNWQLKGNTVA